MGKEYMTATASAPGTCGELVQGSLNGKNFMVSCPIDMWSRVTVFHPQMAQPEIIQELNLQDSVNMTKLTSAIQSAWLKAQNQNNMTCSGSFNRNRLPSFLRESRLPVGKGMASSTADIIAAYTATSRLFGYEPTPDELADVALTIEPSDGTMFPGLSIFDHKKGLWREPLGTPPELDIVMIDPGGSVNTVTFNNSKQLDNRNRNKQPLILQALAYVTEGIREKDLDKIGHGATISAKANQIILPKPYLEEVIRLSKSVKAVGVNVAHSGTLMGVLLANERTMKASGIPKATDAERMKTVGWKSLEVAEYIRKKYPAWTVYASKMIEGGVRA